MDLSGVLNQSPPPTSGGDAVTEFTTEASNFGLVIKGPARADDRIHRVADIHGTGKNNDTGWYVFKEIDGIYFGAFGSWKAGRGQANWCSREPSEISFATRANIEQARREQERRVEEGRAQAAVKATAIVQAADDAGTNHPYLIAKGVGPHGIKQVAENLVIPVVDIDGNTQSKQEIKPDGSKRYLSGGAIKGGMYRVGKVKGLIQVAEGFATAASIHEATGDVCFVCFDAGNIGPVVDALRSKYSQPIVICADNDAWTDGNPGIAKAQEVAAVVPGVTVCWPTFKDTSTKPTDYNDLAQLEGNRAVIEQITVPPRDIHATPVGIFEDTDIPPRPWVFGDQLLRGYVTGIVAPAGIGKSMLTIQMGVAVALGLDFAGWNCFEQGNVWLYNNEDDMPELKRRFAAACKAMEIDRNILGDWFHLDSGDDRPLLVARADKNGHVIQSPDVDACIAEIRAKDIKVFIVDPFAETHTVNENSNDEIKQVTAMFRRIAKDADCAVVLVHHTRKAAGGFEGGSPGSMDSARGAGAFSGVARVVSTIFGMAKPDADFYGVDEDDRHLYVRYDGAKANLSLVTGKAKWFKRAGIRLANGTADRPPDDIGVLLPWEPPSAFDGITLEDLMYCQRQAQARFDAGEPLGPTSRSGENWVGELIAARCGLDAKEDKKRINTIFKDWSANKAFKVEKFKNAKSNLRDAVLVDTWKSNEN